MRDLSVVLEQMGKNVYSLASESSTSSSRDYDGTWIWSVHLTDLDVPVHAKLRVKAEVFIVTPNGATVRKMIEAVLESEEKIYFGNSFLQALLSI